MPHVCQDRALALAEMGHDIHVLSTGLPGKDIVLQSRGRVTVHHLCCKPQVYSAEFATLCARACESLEPDILHMDSCDLARPWWKDRPGRARRVAVTMHGFSMGGWLTSWNLYRSGVSGSMPPFPYKAIAAEAEVLRNTFDQVLAISLHEQTLLRDQYGIFNARLVYNPIAECFFEHGDAGWSDEHPPYFLCAAISGHGTRLFKVAEQAAARAGVLLRVVSGCLREKMPAMIDQCIALVVPTAYCQGYDLTVAEALARRRPVIMSATGSYLREWQAGLKGFMRWVFRRKRVSSVFMPVIQNTLTLNIHTEVQISIIEIQTYVITSLQWRKWRAEAIMRSEWGQ